MHRFELRTRLLFVVLAAAAAAAAVGTPAGQARTTDGPPAATRDGGHGRWFRHVCSLPDAHFAWCGAQVVTSSDGVPLASTTPPASALTPAQFHNAYALPTTAPGTPTIGIVDATNDANIESDLATFDQQYNLPACTTANLCFRKVDQNGGTNYPLNSGWHLEIALDVETAHAMCQNCKILLVEASSASMANLGKAENEAVALGANVVSNSYGGSEFSGETSYDTSYYNHPGVPITVSSGDSGYGVEYPAASQYVTAVGGTTLTLNADGSYRSEAAWNDAGSGCSAYEPKPSWQEDGGCANRTVADVSADADPNSGAAIYDSVGASRGKAWFQVGGTSLAAPLIASVYALNGAPIIYGSAPYASTSHLNDVTSGSNGSCSPSYLCTSGAGYDGPTGLGTPKGLGAFGGSVAPSPDFSLSASPSSATVVAGAQASYPVTVNSLNGFAGSVSLNVTAGLPAKASASFTGTTLNVQTAGVAAGTYTLTITGTSTSPDLSHNTTVSLTVQDFSLGIGPSTQTLTQGGTTTYTVTVTPQSGFGASLTWGVTSLPAGVTWKVGSPTGNSYPLTLTATSTATLGGPTTFTVTGTSASDSHTANASVTVQAPPTGDFSLSVSPSTQSVNAGTQAVFTVTVAPVNGFSGSVTLSQTGVPAGASPTFGPNPATTTATLTVATASLTPGTSYPFTVTGTSGALTHTTQGTLTVNAAGGPTLSVSPTSAPHGTRVTVTWSGVAKPTAYDWIGIFTPGASSSSYLSYEYDSTCAAGYVGSARSSGSCSFTLPGSPGQYELRLMANNGSTPIVSGVLVTAT